MRLISNPWVGEQGYHCFGCCPDNPFGLQMTFYEEGDDVVSLWRPAARFQSWRNILHGGIQSVLLDEVCGWVMFHKIKASGVTAKMETKFRKPVVLQQSHIELRARLKELRRNVAIVEGEIRSSEGEILVECICTYFTFDPSKAPENVPYRPTELVGNEVSKEDILASNV
jgi:acyl-coenzyme A thioesterase PaaI-like protein